MRRGNRRIPRCLLTLVVATSAGAHAGGDSDEAVALRWVGALPRHGIYTDAYAPHDPPSPMTMEGQARMLPVALLDYYDRAWETFLEQEGLTDAQRQARHYKVGHTIEGDTLIVVIQGLRLPRIVDGRPDGMIRVAVGPSMRLRFDLKEDRLIGTRLLR